MLAQDPLVVQTPKSHVAERVPAYPTLQTGVHMVPLAELMAQFPASALAITGREGQAVLAQVPVVIQLPEEHVAERVPENPALQVGVQVVPLAEFATQFPALASGMVGKAEQAWPPTTAHAPDVDQVPVVQVAERVPENPELQVGVHMVPLAELATQFPAPASWITGSPEQGNPIHAPVVVQVPSLQEAERVPE